jgi:hypothetical protein
MGPTLTVLQLTGEFMRCVRCRTDPSTFRSDGRSALTTCWYPPRGWAGTTESGRRPLMLVSLNPGRPITPEITAWQTQGITEAGCCKVESDGHDQHAQMVLDRCTESYLKPAPGRDFEFHRRVVDFARSCLWIMGLPVDDWLRYCWFTDIFKCSTRSEGSPIIPAGAFNACEPHIKAEIEHFQPDLIVAFGSAAKCRLRKQPKVIGCPHPSPNNNRPPSPWRHIDDPSHDERFKEIARIVKKPFDDAN